MNQPALDVAEPQLRSRQVAQDPDLLATGLGGGPGHLDILGVSGLIAMREVEPEDVRSRFDELPAVLTALADGTSDAQLDEMCRKLLANMVIENYRIEKVA